MRKRNHVIPVRLNARELRELEEQVEKSGLSREEFMRSGMASEQSVQEMLRLTKETWHLVKEEW